MATNTLHANRVFVIHLRSYGFFHSGRERLVVQVLKRTWEHMPGSTLYGALSAALIRLDPPEDLDNADPATARGYYFELLRTIERGEIRFTPLLPAASPVLTGAAYCEQAMTLAQAGTLETRRLLHTTPHAPIDRSTEQIHGDQLFAVRTHRAFLDYYGFIFGQAAQRAWLERGLSLLPFIAVGGEGKFSFVEGEIMLEFDLVRFSQELSDWAAQRWAENKEDGSWIRLLTPLVRPKTGIPEPLDAQLVEEVIMTRFQRYRVWRTGRYFNGEGFDAPVGIGPYYGADDALLQAGGTESVAMQAVPEHSRFCIKKAHQDKIVPWFIEGIGHPGWRYLGWGQMVIE